MGIFDSIGSMVRGQFVDVIEWTGGDTDTMVHKYDRHGDEIMMGAQLTVREGQAAIFVNEGQVADVFGPGRYELQTANMPIMTKLQAWKFGFNSPFKADVYFVNTRQFLDRKWGTANPVMMRDAEFGIIRLRAYGIFAFRVTDPSAFLREVFGHSSLFTAEEVEGQIKRTLVSGLSDAIAQSRIPALDLAANYDELGAAVMQSVNPKVEALGLGLTSLVIENISLPEEVEKTMDRRTAMGVIGDMGRYSQYQAAETMREAANNPAGSLAGAGVGMGAGMAVGQMFASAMQRSQQVPEAAAGGKFCSACGAAAAPGAKFCSGCGARLAGASACPACGHSLTPGAKFCPDCGAKL